MAERVIQSGEVKLFDSLHHRILELHTNKNTVKTPLSGPPIKQTLSIKRTLSWVPNECLIFPSITNPYSATPLLSGRRLQNKLYWANFYC